MLIEVKQNLHGLFLHQNTPLSPLEKNISEKSFLNHPYVHIISAQLHMFTVQFVHTVFSTAFIEFCFDNNSRWSIIGITFSL